MKGQWIGDYHNKNISGKLIINIDEVEGHYEGKAFRYTPGYNNIPTSIAELTTTNTSSEQKIIVDVYTKDSPDQRKEANFTLKILNEELHLNATSSTDPFFTLTCILAKSSENGASKIIGEKKSWGDFKSYIKNKSKDHYLFRGQEEPLRLRTSFHRCGRYQIDKFVNEDIPQLHKKLSSITSHFFVLDDPVKNGAFWSLLQHHGYPTPLLDWSYSPYVAAFFAFQKRPKNYDGEELTRIYLFDNDSWKKRYPQISDIHSPYPHLSIMDFASIDNPRMVTQQAATTFTNIEDIEAYVLEKEADDSAQYLQAIDIPAKDREEVMNDLRFMGITAGSLFPGIDGVCEDLKERNFG